MCPAFHTSVQTLFVKWLEEIFSKTLTWGIGHRAQWSHDTWEAVGLTEERGNHEICESREKHYRSALASPRSWLVRLLLSAALCGSDGNWNPVFSMCLTVSLDFSFRRQRITERWVDNNRKHFSSTLQTPHVSGTRVSSHRPQNVFANVTQILCVYGWDSSVVH